MEGTLVYTDGKPYGSRSVNQNGHFSVFGGAEKTVVGFILIMPPSKIGPQCDAVVLKVCKSCQHVFRAKK